MLIASMLKIMKRAFRKVLSLYRLIPQNTIVGKRLRPPRNNSTMPRNSSAANPRRIKLSATRGILLLSAGYRQIVTSQSRHWCKKAYRDTFVNGNFLNFVYKYTGGNSSQQCGRLTANIGFMAEFLPISVKARDVFSVKVQNV